jgi:hypothetical protein
MKRPKSDGWNMHPLVSETLRDMLPRHAKVVELGGGTGSPYLQHLFPNTTTIEHDQSWADYLSQMQLTYMHVPLSGGWYKETPLLIAKLAEAHCIIVDGPPGRMRPNVRGRLRYFPADCIVVFDDSQRDHNEQLIRKLMRDQGWQALEAISDGKRTTTILKTPPGHE